MKLAIALAAALLLSPLTAFAADSTTTTAPAAEQSAAPEQGKRWAACADDVKKFCANIERGKGQIRSCLEGHTSELSDSCKQRMAERREKTGAQPN